MCVGRLSQQKGQDVAIRALALVDDRSARLRLVGAESGAGSARDSRRSRDRSGSPTGSNGVARSTTRHLSTARRTWSSRLRRWDGLSLALLEAMACGATIVASDVYGSESLGDAGVIVPPDDPRGLADAIAALLRDALPKGSAGSLGARPERLVRSRYDDAAEPRPVVWARRSDPPGQVSAASADPVDRPPWRELKPWTQASMS